MSTQMFLDLGMAQTAGEGAGFFANNRLVKVCAGLDGFSLASEGEKASLIKTLGESANSFPPEFANDRILPSLISALEFGGSSASSILPLVLKFGKNVSPDDYNTNVLYHVIKLYERPDRGMRMALLDHLSEYSETLEKKAVVDQIWPHLQTGFNDTVSVIREATVKAISLLSPKLNDRILNNDLLRYLAKAQSDPEASIRTNTCILIGRLGPTLGYNTKRKVLVPAFTKALKDPFVHARVAGLMAFMATVDCFEIEELASKVIPNMSFSLLDREKLVRDQAFKALDFFVKKLEAHAASMPESAPADELSIQIPGATLLSTNQAAIVGSAAGAAGALAGWAISSIGKRLASGDLQSTMNVVAGAGIERPTSAPQIPGGLSDDDSFGGSPRPPLPTSASAFSSPVVTSQSTSASKPFKAKGMQLASKKVSTSTLAFELAEEAANAEASTEGNPWGTDDLIDVNADDGDWSAFESAPVPTVDLHPAPMVNASLPNDSNVNPWDGLRSPPDDPWAENTTFSYPSLSTKTKPRTQVVPKPAAPPSKPTAARPVSPVPNNDSWDSPSNESKTLAGGTMSKEDKAAEMAKRKEETKDSAT